MEGVVPLAIVGISCRFSGDATDPEALYRMCAAGRDSWCEVPSGRYNVDGFYHPDPDRSGAVNLRGGHFMREDLGHFDANFFSLKASEVKAMDPQQRILLECTYEALENAGIPMENVVGSNTGVYIGSSCRDYRDEVFRDPEQIPVYSSTGTEQSLLSNRISFFFDLKGPSLSIDTACSSSLAAFHVASQSLRTGESQMAIVGGANLIIGPNMTISMSMMRFYSPDGRSFAFDNRANGYGRGEGVGCIIVKTLEDAIRDGDTIRAVVRNTGMNQDGRTASLTVPNGDAQMTLIRDVYKAAMLNPLHTHYVEAHGTGTPTGDPIEARAIATVFGSSRSREVPLLIGSVKTNLGHLEGASGIAGLIKTILMLERGVVFPNANFQKPSTRIPFEEWNIKVSAKIQDWKTTLRRASVNSFGFGGANVHVILENANSSLLPFAQKAISHGQFAIKRDIDGKAVPEFLEGSPSRGSSSHRKLIYILSANDADTGRKYVQLLAAYLQIYLSSDTTGFMKRLAFTLGTRRSSLAMRMTVTATNVHELLAALLKEDIQFVRSVKRFDIGFVFTGQGAQWVGMGRELIDVYPLFKSTLVAADECLKSLGAQWSLIDLLWLSEASQISQAAVSQPLCTALQIALVVLLRSWNIKPSVVVGHSSGEIAAAYTIGALGLESCMQIAYWRGYLAQELKTKRPGLRGAMLVVGAPENELRPLLKQARTGKAVIACVNSPSSTTISGDESAILELKAVLDEKHTFARKLHLDVAYHSHHMQVIAEDYRMAIKHIEPRVEENVKMFSTVTGNLVEHAVLGPEYWVQNLVSPVLFANALRSLLNYVQELDSTIHVGALIEIGPHSALKAPMEDVLGLYNSWKVERVLVQSTLLRGKDSVTTMMNLAGKMSVRGHPVNVSALNSFSEEESCSVLVDLPPYPWNHKERYWHDTRASHDYRFRSHPRDDLIGAIANDSTSSEPRWRNIIRPKEMPWIRDHMIQSQIIFPGAAYVAMAVQACRIHTIPRQENLSGYALRQISVLRALVIPNDSDGTEVMISLRPFNESHKMSSDIWYEFSISSWMAESGWNQHCHGLVCAQQKRKPDDVDTGSLKSRENVFYESQISDAHASCTTHIDMDLFYRKLDKVGMNFGSTFHGLTEMLAGKSKSIGTLLIPNTAAVMPFEFEYSHIIHPATLDTIFQPTFAALAGKVERIDRAMVPVFIEELFISAKIPRAPGQQLRIYANAELKGHRDVVASSFVLDTGNVEHEPVLVLKGQRGIILPPEQSENPSERNLCFRNHWFPDVDMLGTEDVIRLVSTRQKADPLNKTRAKSLDKANVYYMKNAMHVLAAEVIIPPFPHLKKLWAWMKTALESVNEQPISSELDSAMNFPREEIMSLGPNDDLLSRMGENLPKIMKGEKGAQFLLSQDAVLQVWQRNESSFKAMSNQAARYISLQARKRPHLNILDLGGNSVGTSKPILEALAKPGQAHLFGLYEIAAFTRGDLDEARAQLQPWSKLTKFTKMNIERDIVAQGFSTEHYDLIIASNVLSATTKMDRTITNVRKLLKPGGKLILCELLRPEWEHFLMFGSLPSWWLGEDEAQRSKGPLTPTEWKALLEKAEFCDICIDTNQIPGGVSSPYGMILCTRTKETTVDFNHKTTIASERPSDDPLMYSISSSLAKLTGKEIVHSSVSDCTDRSGVFVVTSELDKPFLTEPTPQEFRALKGMIAKAEGILWIIDPLSPARVMTNFVSGFARVLMREDIKLKFVVLELENSHLLTQEEFTNIIKKVYAASFSTEAISRAREMEYLVKDGYIHIARVFSDLSMDEKIGCQLGTSEPTMQAFLQENRPLRLEIETPGLLNTLRFVDDDDRLNGSLSDEDIRVDVKAMGVNFRDIMMSTGQIETDLLGTEFSGMVTAVGSKVHDMKAGDRVLGWANGTYANTLQCRAAGVLKFSKKIPFEVAASIPVAFCTAYYAIHDLARLQSGESILIHSASGAFGQAAIMMARLVGARVFATVGSKEKQKYLIDEYGIAESDIFFGRNLLFAESVKQATSNKGVDVILNSMAGEALRVTWDCIATFGRFIEVGKRDIQLNTRLEMAQFSRNVMFASIDMFLMLNERVEMIQQLLSKVLTLFDKGKIHPVRPIQTSPVSDIEKVFRYMQNRKHLGKLVIKPSPGDIVKAVPPKLSENRIRQSASYLLVGGLGGVGRSLAMWLVQNGAKNLILTSRSAASSVHAKKLLAEIGEHGAKAIICPCDVTDVAQLESLLKQCAATMPPIRGVIQAAMVLRDSPFETMSLENYTAVVMPKVQGTLNLHNSLSKTDLDFFVMLSSATGIIGNPGQAAYAGGSTFMDGFAKYRRQHGQPAVSLDLGVIRDVGYVAENENMRQALAKIALDQISEKELHALIEIAISEDCSQPETSHIITGLEARPQAGPQKVPMWANDFRFAALNRAQTEKANQQGDGTRDQALSDQLQASETLEDAIEIVTNGVLAKISEIMTIPIEQLDKNASAANYGMDSLAAVEMRNWLRREIGATIHLFELLENVTITQLAGNIVKRSKFVNSTLKERLGGSKRD